MLVLLLHDDPICLMLSWAILRAYTQFIHSCKMYTYLHFVDTQMDKGKICMSVKQTNNTVCVITLKFYAEINTLGWMKISQRGMSTTKQMFGILHVVFHLHTNNTPTVWHHTLYSQKLLEPTSNGAVAFMHTNSLCHSTFLPLHHHHQHHHLIQWTSIELVS